MPVPAAAMLISSTILLYNRFGLGDEVSKYVIVLVYVYLLAFLMISNVKYHSFKELNLSQRMPFRLLVGAIFMLIAVAAEPPLMLFIFSFIYVMSGPVTTLLDRRRRKAAKAAKDEKKDKQELKLHHR